MTLTSPARIIFSALLLLALSATGAWPQAATAPAPAAAAPVAPAAKPAASAPAPAPAKPEADPFGRETPQGMVSGLMNALAAADYERAVKFFETDSVQGVRQWYILSGSDLAKRFQQVLDRAGSVITPAELSNDPNGNVNDGLAQTQERFGAIKEDGRSVPLLATRVKRDGKMLWLVSTATLSEIPAACARA